MRKYKKSQKSKWEWYGVKILYESVVSGNPIPEYIDKNCIDSFKTYEESIIAVKAQSFEHAWSIAEKKARQNEIVYTNPYGQQVKCLFVDILDTFQMFDDKIVTGTELYSRFIHVPIDEKYENIKTHYYPETIEADDKEPDYCYRIRFIDFNLKNGDIQNGEKEL